MKKAKYDVVVVTWEVCDGYAGGRWPQYTEIPLDEWNNEETDEGRAQLADVFVQEDMEQLVTWSIKGIKVPREAKND